MIPLPSLAPLILAAAVGSAGGYLIAAKVGDAKTARVQARLAACEQARAQDARAAAEKAAQLLARAQGAEAQAAARLTAQQSAFERRLKEVRSEIYRLSTGRQCLSGPMRLRLNAALGHAADGLPAPTGAAHPAPAEPAADSLHPSAPGRGAGGEGATDADLAGWILDAAGLYEQCRARIDALRAWDEMTFGDTHGR